MAETPGSFLLCHGVFDLEPFQREGLCSWPQGEDFFGCAWLGSMSWAAVFEMICLVLLQFYMVFARKMELLVVFKDILTSWGLSLPLFWSLHVLNGPEILSARKHQETQGGLL